MSRWVLRYGPIMSNTWSDSGVCPVRTTMEPDSLIPRTCNSRRAEKGDRGRGSTVATTRVQNGHTIWETNTLEIVSQSVLTPPLEIGTPTWKR